jgi:hypothetical protein
VKGTSSSRISSNTLPLPLPSISVVDVPFTISVFPPTEGHVGNPLLYRLDVTNLTNYCLEFSYTVSDSPVFFISGLKKSAVKLLPFSSLSLRTFLVPIESGRLTLPDVHLQAKKYPTHDPLSLTQINNVFIRPSLPVIASVGQPEISQSLI